MVKLTTEEVIRRFRAKHGDRYDYSQTKYVCQEEKVTIICRKHGPFKMNIYNHAKGQNCPYCKGEKVAERNKKYNLETFIAKAREVHGDKYDYSQVRFNTVNDMVTIVCKEHGPFQQLAGDHIYGHGCTRCGSKQEYRKPAYEQLIAAFRAVHGDKYDYSQVNYVNNNTHVTIICKKHGPFSQAPSKHLIGQGCPECKAENLSEMSRDTMEEFLLKAHKAHGDKYDYSKVEYVNSCTPVTIICKKHGLFLQGPHSHVSGRGCPICRCSHGEEKVERWLRKHNIDYIFQHRVVDKGRLYKIDFFLPEKNVFIEFNGIQHYQVVDAFGGEEDFRHRQQRDKSLREYCRRKSIKLIEIPYTEMFNTNAILERHLGGK